MAPAHTRDSTITASTEIHQAAQAQTAKLPKPDTTAKDTSAPNLPPTLNTNLSPYSQISESSAAELRHMTSASNMRHPSGSLRIGNRSPISIPSSPTSVHSSSSAIFERDIEPLPTSLSLPASSHHHIIEQVVPSVLDSAAEMLLSEKEESIDIVAPAYRQSGWTSPMVKSRSPSPVGSKSGTASLLFSPGAASTALSSPPSSVTGSPPTRPVGSATISDKQIPPALITPTSAYYSVASSAESSPQNNVKELPNVNDQAIRSPPTTPPRTARTRLTPLSTTPPAANPKRLSFMSYSDLLNATPTSLMPLSSLTNGAQEPPSQILPADAASIHNAGSRDSILLSNVFKDEWEKEGLGRGLEERIEAIM